jgi:hypothetical protein
MKVARPSRSQVLPLLLIATLGACHGYPSPSGPLPPQLKEPPPKLAWEIESDRGLRKGEDIKYYWTAMPDWGPIERQKRELTVADLLEHPYRWVRITNNQPVVRIYRHSDIVGFLFIMLPMGHVCQAQGRFLMQDSIESEEDVASARVLIRKSPDAEVDGDFVECGEFDQRVAMSQPHRNEDVSQSQ